jgi:hypothetical protein
MIMTVVVMVMVVVIVRRSSVLSGNRLLGRRVLVRMARPMIVIVAASMTVGVIVMVVMIMMVGFLPADLAPQCRPAGHGQDNQDDPAAEQRLLKEAGQDVQGALQVEHDGDHAQRAGDGDRAELVDVVGPVVMVVAVPVVMTVVVGMSVRVFHEITLAPGETDYGLIAGGISHQNR